MKNFLLLFFLAIAFSSMAQKQPQGGYCLMRVFDVNKFAASGSGFMSAQILITYENGEQEKIELQSFSEKTEPDNLRIVVLTMNKLKQKGYLLMSANSTGDQGNIVTDYVFLKNF